MNPRIVMNLPYPKAPDIILQVEKQIGIAIRVVHGVLEQAVVGIKKLVDAGEVDAVISRGITYRMLRQELPIPVISSQMTDFDVLKALRIAKQMGERIAVLGYEHKEFSYEFDDLMEIVGIQVKQYYFEDMDGFEHALRRAKNDGIEVVVVGADYAVSRAEQLGFKAVLVEMSVRSIAQAVYRAIDAIALRRRDVEHLEKLRTIFNSVSEGLIITDHQGIVTLCNKKVESLFEMENQKIVGRHLSELGILPSSEKMEVEASEHISANQIKLKRGTQLEVYTEHIAVSDEKIGTVVTVNDIRRIQHIEQEIRRDLHKKGLISKFSLDDMVVASSSMKRVTDLARKYGAMDSTVLIYGESGTGKEMMAQSMHRANERRSAGPFVAVNCSALPDHLLESELFGYNEGAFTGARKGGRIGLFEQAHNGTIFLDEIGTISPHLQMRLLRVLQEREVMRVGGDRVIPIDVRVVAATNVDLELEMKAGRFRADLYYRLNVLPLHIPPLRQRVEDIPFLIEHLLKKHEKATGLSAQPFPDSLMDKCLQYHWPGNVRELENLVERWVILTGMGGHPDEMIKEIMNSMESADSSCSKLLEEPRISVIPGKLDDMTRQLVSALAKRYSSRSKLAEKLGVSRTTLWRLINGGQ
jgi:PAS domain S-box-containing protein